MRKNIKMSTINELQKQGYHMLKKLFKAIKQRLLNKDFKTKPIKERGKTSI